MLGAFLLNARPEDLRRPWRLVTALGRERGSLFMAGTALFWSLASTYDKLALRHSGVGYHAAIQTGGVALAAGLTLLAWGRQRELLVSGRLLAGVGLGLGLAMAALGLPLNQSYGYPKKLGGNALAAQVMLERTLGRPGTVVLAAWEHINIQFLVEAMGVPRASVPSWPGSDYDTVYVVTVDAHAKLLRFSVAHENYTYTPGGANTTI